MSKRLFWAFALTCVPLVAQAAPFTAGDLVVERVGDGSGALNSSAAAVFVDEYTPSGTFVQSIAMPTAVSGANLRLTESGSATSGGYLNLSNDGRYITLAGYNASPGMASVAGTSTTGGTPVVRVIGRIDGSGNVDTSTSTTAFSGNNVRSAISSNGTDIWASGAGSPGGVIYVPFGNSGAGTQVSSTITNTRVLEIFQNGATTQLYASSDRSGFSGVNAVDSGLPTGSGNLITNVIGSTSAFDFFLAKLNPSSSGVDTAYVADDSSGGGIEKFSLVGSSWVANGIIGVGSDNYRGLTGKVTPTGVQLYVTRQGGLTPGIVSLLDTTGYNATIGGSPTLITALPTNEAFRGIDFVPVANVPEPSTLALGAVGLGLLVAVCRRVKRSRVRSV